LLLQLDFTLLNGTIELGLSTLFKMIMYSQNFFILTFLIVKTSRAIL
jgi:hypothetical protein